MGSGNQPCRILYVEDHADTLDAFSRMLERHGHTVVTAQTFTAALELATAQKFDLLITDVGLPDGDGCDLLAKIRQLYPIRGIVISGYGMAKDVRRSDLAGYAIHLTKPVDREQLTNAVNATVPECAETTGSAGST